MALRFEKKKIKKVLEWSSTWKWAHNQDLFIFFLAMKLKERLKEFW